MKRKVKMIFVAEDAGGQNALRPVVAAARKRSAWRVKAVFGKRQASFKKQFIAFGPDVVITAPGAWGKNMDKQAMMLAKSRGIPTVSVVDFWSRYAGRFSSPGTQDLSLVPDVVCAIDAACKRGLIKDGIETRRIIVTGNPHFETFGGPAEDGRGIVFFCQPFSELKKADPALDYGIDEREAFSDLLGALDAIGVKGSLVLKLHPRTKRPGKFDRLIRGQARRIVVDRTTPSAKLIERSSLVLGMHSMALFEAALRGKRVLSYQPGLNKPDPLMSNTLGLSVGVTEKQRLLPALSRLLAAKPSSKTRAIRNRYVRGHATRYVLRVIETLL